MPPPPQAPPLTTACNPATYVFYDGESADPFIPAGTTSYAYNWWPSSSGQMVCQFCTATSIEDAKSQCDAHGSCDAFAFHNPPTTSAGNGYGKHNYYGYLYLYRLRQQKGDATLSQWYDAVTWSQPGPWNGYGQDFRFFWSIDECVVS